MPRLNGTINDDDIDVTGNVGEVNGDVVGPPIDNVRGDGGDDEITVTNSTIADTGAQNTGNVAGNTGDDTIIVENSTIDGRVSGGRDNDTVTVTGSTVGTIRLGRGDDTLNLRDTNVGQDIRGGSGTDALNLPVGTVVDDNGPSGSFVVQKGQTYTLSNGTLTLPTGQIIAYTTFETGTSVPCFTKGTLVQTEAGPRPIQDVQIGDRIPTLGRGFQQIRWIGRRRFDRDALSANPRLWPVRIVAGALGNGLPARDLLVSRQHRMLVQSRIAQRMFDTSEVLISAIKLTALPGIYVDYQVPEVEYIHLMFDDHQVIFAENAPSESLFAGVEALKSVGPDARREILEIFPQLRDMKLAPLPARFIPCGRQQKRLLQRHKKNDRPLLMG